MSKAAAAAPAAPTIQGRFGAKAWVIVVALVLGLALGMAAPSFAPGWEQRLTAIAGTVGGLWLDALKMTVIPLMMALLVKGIVGGASVASEGRVAARAVAWFVGLYIFSAVVGALVMPPLLDLFPLAPASAEAMRAGFAAVDPSAVQGSVASVSDFIRSFVPANIFAAAASGSILQIVLFTLVFALALSLLEPARRRPVVAFFDAVGDAMLIVIGWVLAVAPLGVFALAVVAGAASGTAVLGAVIQFIALYVAVGLIMIVIAYLVAVFAAGFAPLSFARAMAPTQAIAFSTQSSTGSLPAMLVSARTLGIRERTADIVLPLAAALFRGTGPAMNIALVIFIARMLGIHLSIESFAAGVAIASVATISAPGLPGQVSFFTSVAPIAMAMGVPMAPLGMLIALEPVPDMFRTLGNVTFDVAVAGAVDRQAAKRKS